MHSRIQQIPEYSQINPGMSLEGFKAIYWWEWTHRLLGRLIGLLVFFIPFAVFLARRGSIPRTAIPRIAALFALEQGFKGRWAGSWSRAGSRTAWMSVNTGSRLILRLPWRLRAIPSACAVHSGSRANGEKRACPDISAAG